MQQAIAEWRFLRTLIGLNLASGMEYRISFLSQSVGMLINNGIYFVFWLLFFDRFGAVRGYEIQDIYLLFAVVTLAFGLSVMFAGNAGSNLATIIAHGRLDYYLVFPRNLLVHVLCSRMSFSSFGDVTFGILAFFFAGLFHPVEIGLFLVATILAALVLTAFRTIAGSLAFYMGNAQHASQQMSNALLTFSLYPNSLFAGVARFILYTLLPAAFVGAVPVEIIKGRSVGLLGLLVLVTVLIWLVAFVVFYGGLRRYESGSALNVNM